MGFSASQLTVFFALLAILGRVIFYVITPIWVDYFNIHTSAIVNISNTSNTNHTDPAPLQPAHLISHHINIIFVVVGQYAFSTVVCGISLLTIILISPERINEYSRKYPKKNFFIIGFAQGISSILINFSVSGSRTAPYLQAILSNFGIPIQFIARFILLRKRPTCLKTVCACAVVMAEFVSLLPTIFPSLESNEAKQVEGGAIGPARILWPICMVLSMVPYAIANSIMERSVQDKSPDSTNSVGPTKAAEVHLVYFLFWWCLFSTLTAAGLFWVDFIPGFGTSNSISKFCETLVFNVQCLFGAAGCGSEVATLGWLNFSSNLIGAIAFAGLMRYSEGASFVVIVLAMRTPIVFLFWTLFREQPFAWDPHVALSTWLSLGAISIMLPAIAIYSMGIPSCNHGNESRDDQKSLLDGQRPAIQEDNSSSPVTSNA